MFCGECGAPNTDGKGFCSRCGAPLHQPSVAVEVRESADATAAATTPPTPDLPTQGKPNREFKPGQSQSWRCSCGADNHASIEKCPYCGTTPALANEKIEERQRGKKAKKKPSLSQLALTWTIIAGALGLVIYVGHAIHASGVSISKIAMIALGIFGAASLFLRKR